MSLPSQKPPNAFTRARPELTFDDVVSAISAHVSNGPGWDERWLSPRYFVEYVVGDCNETVSFSKEDIDEGVKTFSESIRLRTNSVFELVEEIVGWSHYCETLLEHFV